MRFRRLEVRAYRAIEHAELELGPGLNVLHGPNDLGKSTLASAMRAALLLPAESSAHQTFLPWHGAGPPNVRLSFERDGTLYRVSKVFGSGSLGSARLESSPDGSSFHEEERGRAVDRRLREILRWGIEAPGGKSGPRGLPESFLSHVLLGTQSDVPAILERSLESDRDGSGRERLHEALQALSQDPVFKRVLEAAQAKVDAAFTPTGRRKTGQGSPLSPLKEQVATLAQELERLAHQRRESEEVQGRIASLSEARARLESERAALEQRAEREAELLERLGLRDRALARRERARQVLDARRAEQAALQAMQEDLASARAQADAHAASLDPAAAALAGAEERAASAERACTDSASGSARAEQGRRRAELETIACEQRGEHAAVERVLALGAELDAASAALRASEAALGRAEAAEAAARRALAAIDAELAELREIEAVASWQEAELAVQRARAARAEADALRAQADALRARAASETASLELLESVSESTFAELRALEEQMRLAAARLDVGLSLSLRLPAGADVVLRVDGGPEQREAPLAPAAHADGVGAARGAGADARANARAEQLELLAGAPSQSVEGAQGHGAAAVVVRHARSRIAASLSGGVELEASAGDPALRDRLLALERRWAEQALPLLQRWAVDGLDALARELEQARARQRESAGWLREAAAASERAAEKAELAGDLERLEQRAAQRRQALAHLDDAALAARAHAATLGGRDAPPRAARDAEVPAEREGRSEAQQAQPLETTPPLVAVGEGTRRARRARVDGEARRVAPPLRAAEASVARGARPAPVADAEAGRVASPGAGARAAAAAGSRPAAPASDGEGLRLVSVARAGSPVAPGARPASRMPDAEAGLERRRALASAERGRRDAQLQTELAARSAALARCTALREARDALELRLAEAWAAHARSVRPLPSRAELLELRAALAARVEEAAGALERWDGECAQREAALRREREAAARALTAARERHDAAQAASRGARERVLTLEARVNERRGRLDPEADLAAERELAAAAAELEQLGELPPSTPEQLAATRAELERGQADLERTLAELRRAEGALGHVGGDVVAMRLRQTEEALERARAQELEQERDYDAYKLLLETLRSVENEQGAHLGRALEAPVSERFERLTEGRYRQVGFDGALGLSGVAVAGRPRAYGELSEGTQEQLATILRLCIAEYLQTALVLDDHLAQTHQKRAEWFRATLREAAERIQIIVLTARPEDYLTPDELRAAARADTGALVRAVDLERVIRRAEYGMLH